jgi:hypothetical protein
VISAPSSTSVSKSAASCSVGVSTEAADASVSPPICAEVAQPASNNAALNNALIINNFFFIFTLLW